MKKKWLWICFVQIFLGIVWSYIDQQRVKIAMCDIKGGCGSGPCWDYGTGPCGYWYGKNCVLTETGCAGSCGTRCQGTEESEYCAGLIFNCTDKIVKCADKWRPVCMASLSECVCKGGILIGTCSRSDC